jgi:hypothetical protein
LDSTAGGGSFVSPFEGREVMTCTEVAGGGFGNAGLADDEGECASALVRSLLMTVKFLGRFVTADASFRAGRLVNRRSGIIATW